MNCDNYIVWVVNVGPLVVNHKEDRGDTRGFTANDHREENEAIRRWDLGESGGGRRTRGSRNPVG